MVRASTLSTAFLALAFSGSQWGAAEHCRNDQAASELAGLGRGSRGYSRPERDVAGARRKARVIGVKRPYSSALMTAGFGLRDYQPPATECPLTEVLRKRVWSRSAAIDPTETLGSLRRTA